MVGLRHVLRARGKSTKFTPKVFLGQDHLRQVQQEAQNIVSETLARSARTS
jgi:hypothetical protein